MHVMLTSIPYRKHHYFQFIRKHRKVNNLPSIMWKQSQAEAWVSDARLLSSNIYGF